MPIAVHWHNIDETIMVQTFTGEWTIEQYMQVVDEGATRIRALPHTVHVILDFSASSQAPKNLIACGNYAEKRLPANQGVVVFLRPNAIIKAFLRVGRSLQLSVTNHLHLADTLDEAIAIIEREQAALPA